MSYALSIRLMAEPLRSLADSSIGATYMGVGTAFDHPIRLLYVQNLTDVNILFSFDGVNDHWCMPRDGYMILDVTANKTRDSGWYIAEGQRIYVKEETTSPASGAVYVSAFYGSEGDE